MLHCWSSDADAGAVEQSKCSAGTNRALFSASHRHGSSKGLEIERRTDVQGECTIDRYDGEPGESSVFGASFNFINSIVGAGIIAIPSAVQQCGLILGVLLLILVAYLVKCSVLMLIDCGLQAGKYDLEELAEHLLGRRGYYFTLVFMFLFGYGAQIAYLVVLGDTIPRAAQLLTPGNFFCSRFNTLLLLGTLFVLPLSSVRKLSTLAWASMISVAGVVVVILIVLIACATLSSNHQDQHFETSDIDVVNDSLFAGVGTMAFAFVCQHNSFMVFRSLAQPTAKEWRKVADLSLGFAWFVCTAFGLIGFFTFFPFVQGDLLNNFPVNSVAIACARLFLAFTMILTYPMECYVTRHCVLSIITKIYDDRRAAQGITDPAPNTNSVVYKMDKALAAMTDAIIIHATTVINRLQTSITGVNLNQHHHNSTASVTSPIRRHENSTYTSVVGNNDSHVPYHGSDNHVSEITNPILTNAGHCEGNATANSDRVKREPTNLTTRSTNVNNSITTHYMNNANDTSLPATDRASSAAHIGCTLLLWVSSLCIALVFEELGVVASLTGAVAASMLGFVLPATLYLKTHEIAVRDAYRQSKTAYEGTISTSSHNHVHREGIQSTNSGTTQLHSTVHSEDIVVNPIKNLWPTDRDPSPLQPDEETTITFSHIDAHVDDTKDGEVNLSNTPDIPPNRTYKCSAVENTTVWRMIIPFRQFWLPFFMIFFGFVSLIVGVMTVFRDSS
eukprot:gene11482-13348_t